MRVMMIQRSLPGCQAALLPAAAVEMLIVNGVATQNTVTQNSQSRHNGTS